MPIFSSRLFLPLALAASPFAAHAAPAIDTAQLAAGEKVFAQCKACHAIEKGKADGVGPNLYGVYGSKAGGHSATFKYSAAMKASGQTWNDAFGSTVGGTVTTGNGYNGVIYSLLADGTYDPTESSTSLSQLHAGFVDTDATDPEVTALEHVTVDFGTKLAGKKVLVRFREVSDPFTGVFGWVVDNIAFTGASNKPFSSTVADAAKAEKLPVAVAASPTSAHTGKTVGLDGSGSSDPFGAALTYAWTQTAGPTVALSDATAAKPSFKPSSSGTYTFQLIVTDTYGKASTPATTSVKVTHPSDDGGAFNPLLLSGLALAALARKRRALK